MTHAIVHENLAGRLLHSYPNPNSIEGRGVLSQIDHKLKPVSRCDWCLFHDEAPCSRWALV
jgi:hypothetical protein